MSCAACVAFANNSKNMTTEQIKNPVAGLPACPLFPAEQALLWVPEFSGNRTAFQSYNGHRGVVTTVAEVVDRHGGPPRQVERHDYSNDMYGTGVNEAGNTRLGHDERGVSLCAPFTVSQEEPIGWNDNCGTRYTLVPLRRAMTTTHVPALFPDTELGELCLRVIRAIGRDPSGYRSTGVLDGKPLHHDDTIRVLMESRLAHIKAALAAMCLLSRRTNFQSRKSL